MPSAEWLALIKKGSWKSTSATHNTIGQVLGHFRLQKPHEEPQDVVGVKDPFFTIVNVIEADDSPHLGPLQQKSVMLLLPYSDAGHHNMVLSTQTTVDALAVYSRHCHSNFMTSVSYVHVVCVSMHLAQTTPVMYCMMKEFAFRDLMCAS